MPSNIDFKNSSLLVNSNLVGLRGRVKKHGGEIGNFALRADWGTSDHFRGVLGKYWAQYTTANGTSLVNFASDKITDPALNKQVMNIALKVREIPSTGDNIGSKSAKFLIELNNEAWKALNYGSSTKSLLRKDIEEAGVHEGDPYWKWYLKEGMPQNAVPHVPMPPVINTQATYTDHTTLYYTPSSVENIRAKSGAVLKLESVYNYYADTTPPYEQISQLATEPMLTNFYCLESEMRNTGSTLNSPDYFAQLTLDNALQQVNIDNDGDPDPWFQSIEGPECGMTESKTVQLYTLFSKGLSQIENTIGLSSLKSTFNARYKNIVILNSDLEAMNDLAVRDDKTTGLSNLPFYNKITIGYDTQAVGDYDDTSGTGGASWFREVQRDLKEAGAVAFDSFMDILQLYIIQNIENGGGASPTNSFTRRSVTRQSDVDPTAITVSVEPSPVAFVFNMDNFLKDIVLRAPLLGGAGLAPTRIEQVVERINTNSTTDDNLILIRNYNQNTVESDDDAAKKFLELVLDDRIVFPTRTAKEIILENRLAANETILYKIDKTVVGGEGTEEIVQTFYIGRHFDQVRDIHYIDSQVKYGVRYRYNISEIKVVFGNQYSYRDLKLFFHEAAGYGRAVGNALGFYRPVADAMLDDVVERYVKEYTPPDKDLDFSAVGIDTVGETSHTGYYIFKPTNRSQIDIGAYTNLFGNGTGWCADSNGYWRRGLVSERLTLEKINVQVKEGFGFSGNDSGGAVGGTLDLPIVVTTTPAPQPAPSAPPITTRPKGSRPSRPTNIRIRRAPLPGTTQGPRVSISRRPAAQSVRRARGPSRARVPRVGTRMNRPGGVTPPLRPNLLQNLFRFP